MLEFFPLLFSFIALFLCSCSYFSKKKIFYLIFQMIAIVFLILSYLAAGQFFATVSLAICLFRTLVYFLYERKDKKVPVLMVALICALVVSAYFVVNFVWLKTANPLDLLYVFSLCGYAVTFSIRNLRLMRALVILPHILAVSYNVLLPAPIFTTISYSMEFAATLVAIMRYDLPFTARLFAKKKNKNEVAK